MKESLSRKLPSAITSMCNFRPPLREGLRYSERREEFRSGIRYILSYTIKKIFFCLEFLVILSLFLTCSLTSAQVGQKKADVEKVEYTSQDLPGPFTSPFEREEVIGEDGTSEADLSHLQVQGMIWGSSMPQAIVNDTVVEIGEEIGDAEILDIRREGIYVLYRGRQYILRPSILKK